MILMARGRQIIQVPEVVVKIHCLKLKSLYRYYRSSAKGRYWAFSKTTFENWVESGKVKFKKEVKGSERGFIVKNI